jgi:hypothetical protein
LAGQGADGDHEDGVGVLGDGEVVPEESHLVFAVADAISADTAALRVAEGGRVVGLRVG